MKMDWLKFYNEIDVLEALEKIWNINDPEQVFSPNNEDGDDRRLLYYSQQVERNVGYAIFEFKNNTRYFNKTALIEYIKLEKTKSLEFPFDQLPTKFFNQLNFQATNAYRIFLTQLEESLQKKPKIEPEPLPTLEEVFKNKKDLLSIVELLKNKCFVVELDSRLFWTGIEHETARGRGNQLVALSYVCMQKNYYKRPNDKRPTFNAKELHHAWTKYFNYDIAYNNFKPNVNASQLITYEPLFNFIRI